MNKSKAITGWNPRLVSGRDFRVEDHGDGRGQVLVWLRADMPPPGEPELDAGWEAWLARRPRAQRDAVSMLAEQIEAIRVATGVPATAAFAAHLGDRHGNHG